jgi:hypothetical protein
MQDNEPHPIKKLMIGGPSRRALTAGFGALAASNVLRPIPSRASPYQPPNLLGCTGFVTVGDRFLTMYLWAYNVNNGNVFIHQLIGPGNGNDPFRESVTWPTDTTTATWDKGFSSFVSISLEENRGPYIWAYRSSDGRLCIHRINDGGIGFTQKFISNLDTQFSGFARVGSSAPRDTNFILAYRIWDGLVCIYEIKSDGTGITEKYRGRWQFGFTHFTGYNHGEKMYVLAYRGYDGIICVLNISQDGNGFSQVSQRSLETGLSAFATNDWGDARIWAYRSQDGMVRLLKMDGIGPGLSDLGTVSWRPGFSNFCKFELFGAYVWAYASDARIFILKLDPQEPTKFSETYIYSACTPTTC